MTKSRSIFTLLSMILVVSTFVGCNKRPFDVPTYVDVKSNESVFLIPASTTETNKQATFDPSKADAKSSDQTTPGFMTEEFYKKTLVEVGRVRIPHEWVPSGKREDQGKWVETMIVVKVDRTPVSVTWTNEDNGGNNNTKIGVENSTGIGFTVPTTLTAMIEKEDAPKFLYKYAGRSLADVVNSDINAFVKTNASAKFAKLSLEECKKQKNEIYAKIFEDLKVYCKTYGITIAQFGTTDGFLFDDKNYQDALNQQAVLAQQKTNLIETEAIAIKNREIAKNNADNEAKIANIKASTVGTLLRLQEVENSKILTQAQADAIRISAEKGIVLPDVVPESVFYNLGLDKYVPTSKANQK